MSCVPGALADGVDPSERLSADDMATLREGQFLQAALQRHRSGAKAHIAPGVCRWCGEHCLPLAVYCDDDCRADHEARQQILRRQGRG